MKQLTFRIKDGFDLKKEIIKIVEQNDVGAGIIASIVGGIKFAKLRMPGGKAVKIWNTPLEIVSGTGTVSRNGCHIHISVSDTEGATYGGHLVEGCIVRNTAEIVLLVFGGIEYKRKFDEETGYNELVI